MTGPVTQKLGYLRASLLAWAAEGRACTPDDLRLAAAVLDAVTPCVEALEDQPIPARFRSATIIPLRVSGGIHQPESAA